MSHCWRWRGRLAVDPTRALSPGSVRLVYAVLRTMLSAAVDDGVLTADPANGLGRRFRLHRPSAERQGTMKALTREQVAAFLDAARQRVPEYWPFFLLLARTGLRLGEALALQKFPDFQKGFDLDRANWPLVGSAQQNHGSVR